MTSKERVLMAINHEEPDKVPLDSWLAPEVAEVLIRLLGVDMSKDPFSGATWTPATSCPRVRRRRWWRRSRR
jgi:hypothetical protein